MKATIVTVTLNPAIDALTHVDEVAPERKLRCTRPLLEAGGGGLNVARAVRRLGGDARALWLSGGIEGKRLAQLLDDHRIDHDFIEVGDETRRNLNVVDDASGQMYRFGMPGAHVSERECAALLDRVAALEAAEWLVLSGSLPEGAPADTYARIAKRAPRGARIVLDTSGSALREGLRGGIFLAKPNRRELEQLAGGPLREERALADAARALVHEGHVEVLVVSLGDQGLLVVTRDRSERIVSPDIEVRSAVGAGDSTVAGLVLGLCRGMSVEDAARFGAAAGTAAVMTPGTELCRREDTERLYAAMTNK